MHERVRGGPGLLLHSTSREGRLRQVGVDKVSLLNL